MFTRYEELDLTQCRAFWWYITFITARKLCGLWYSIGSDGIGRCLVNVLGCQPILVEYVSDKLLFYNS